MLRQADFRAFYSSLRHKLFASMFGIVSVFGVMCSANAASECYQISYVAGDVVGPVGNMPTTTGTVCYGNDGYNLPDNLTASGYVFMGWSCDVSLDTAAGSGGYYAYAPGQSYTYLNHTDVVCTALWAAAPNCGEGTPVAMVLNEFADNISNIDISSGVNTTDAGGTAAVFNSYGTVYIEGMLSGTPGTMFGHGNPDPEEPGNYCWCRVSGFTPNGDSASMQLSDTAWVLANDNGYPSNEDCARACVGGPMGNSSGFRYSLYSYATCAYTITYTPGAPGSANVTGMPNTNPENVVPGLYYNLPSGPSAAGYSFRNWSCSYDLENGDNIGENIYGANDSYTFDGNHNVTCEAQWDCADGYAWDNGECVLGYSLTYHCNNGDNEQSELLDEDGPYQSDAEVTLWTDDGTSVGNCDYKDGHYKFSGWDCMWTNEEEGIDINDGKIIMPEYNVKCIASWTPLYLLQYTCGTINGSAVSGDLSGYNEYLELNAAIDTTHASSLTCSYDNQKYQPDGWSCHRSSGNNTASGVSNMQNTGVTCDAQWDCADGYVLENGQCVLQSNYTLRYGIDAPSYLGVSAPGNPNPMASGTSYTLEAVPSGTGYSCSDWDCRYSGGQSLCVDNGDPVLCSGGATVSMPPANVSCRSTCSANNVLLVWKTDGGTLSSSNPGYCPYGDPNGISQIYQPTKAGHMFKGWLLTNYNATSLGAVDILEGSSGRKWRSAHGLPGTSDTHGYLTSYTNSLENGQWVAYFPSYGVIKGESACSMETMGSVPQPLSTGTPGSQTANTSVRQYCWCRVISYVSNNSTFTSFDNSSLPWIYLKKLGSGAECIGSSGSTNCAYQCAWATVRPTTDNENEYNSRYRAALYGMVTQ